jgi:hypothetical protein
MSDRVLLSLPDFGPTSVTHLRVTSVTHLRGTLGLPSKVSGHAGKNPRIGRNGAQADA